MTPPRATPATVPAPPVGHGSGASGASGASEGGGVALGGADPRGVVVEARPPARSAVRRYLVALLACALALGVSFWLERHLDRGAFAVLSGAVVLAAWYGGLGPALLVSVLSVAAADYFFIEPRHAFGPDNVFDLVPFGVFAIIAVIVSTSADSLRRTREQAAQRAAELATTNDELRAERAAALLARGHLERLFDVTAALSSALTPDAVAEVVVEQGVLALGARAGSVALLDERAGELEVVRTAGYSAEATARYRRIPLEADFPLSEAARTGEAIILATAEARDARYPQLAALRRANGNGAMAALPLFAGQGLIGVLGFNFPDGHPLDEADRQFALTLAQQCAHALERARLYEAERQARAEAESANRAKSDFLAMMSHELRTPLNAIAGYTELLEMEIRGPVTPQQREDLGRIRRSQRHLLGIINDILNFAKIEAGQVQYTLAPLELDPLLAGLEVLVAPQLSAKSLHYELHPAGAAARALADRDKLQQVLLNLLSNAVKFTPAGGRIVIEGEGRGDRVEIRVRDTGPGIPADRRERIFEPFVQLDTQSLGAREGTGLGLAISRDLARGMGGDLTVESTPGAGATFVCTLRRAEAR